jgi:hypothetical protein
MEENLFRCIPQREKTSSVASHNGGKSLPLWDKMEKKPVLLWDTMRKIFLHCIPPFFWVVFIMKKKLSSGVGYSVEKASVKWHTVHSIRFCCGVGYNERKIPALWDTTKKNLLAIHRLFCVVSHNGKNLFLCVPQRKPSPLYPKTEKLFLCISQQK